MTSGMDNASMVLGPKFLQQYAEKARNLTVLNN